MNRLILIGNGFDLAHGMKTGYNDFILWYLKEAFGSAYVDQTYEDKLLKIEKTTVDPWVAYEGKDLVVNSLIDYFYEHGFRPLIENESDKTEETIIRYQLCFRLHVKSDLLRNLLLKCSHAKWVDIENEFYDQLKTILGYSGDYKNRELQSLNTGLSEIINHLGMYLAMIKPKGNNAKFQDIFSSSIDYTEIIGSAGGKMHPDQTLMLNFNYTPTAETYCLKIKQAPNSVTLNHIHGKLGDPNNPLIFGFGDELDEHYLKMEHEKTKGFFQYIKSFWYFQTSNYHNLVRFIDSQDFQVFVFGHSCGLSDRTMLNMIFEHDNCKSIKIYYHGDPNGRNNYRSLTEEISRHFKDKVKLRKRIVPFDKSEPMPQVTCE